jgi:hypothetical protein
MPKIIENRLIEEFKDRIFVIFSGNNHPHINSRTPHGLMMLGNSFFTLSSSYLSMTAARFCILSTFGKYEFCATTWVELKASKRMRRVLNFIDFNL